MQTPRHSIAVRRQALTAQLPREGAPNPEARPTWVSVSCAPDSAAPAGAAPDTTPRAKP
jgi:hypothetical protein